MFKWWMQFQSNGCDWWICTPVVIQRVWLLHVSWHKSWHRWRIWSNLLPLSGLFKHEYRSLILSSYCDVISEAIIMKFTFVEIRFNIRGPFCLAYNVILMQKGQSLGCRCLLAIVPFNIGPKYEFVSSLVQNSQKQESHSRSNTIFDAWADHSAQ